MANSLQKSLAVILDRFAIIIQYAARNNVCISGTERIVNGDEFRLLAETIAKNKQFLETISRERPRVQ